jgi:HEAT repeat protein
MPAGSPLQALAASSALGSPQALTDGDPNTYWGESRGGDGRGEFVVLRASKALPLSAFHFLIRASAPDAGSSLEPKTSPKQFWLATDEQLYSVKMPEDGWQKPGISYRVVLPKAIQSECVALVLESSFSTRKDAEVVLAELSAETPLDGRDVHDLVRALNGGGESAKAVVAALRKGGVLAFRAIAEDFSGLDERGRELALEAIDGAPCTETVPVYMAALSGPYPGQKTHVESRLARCGGDLGRAIATELRSATTPLETKLKLAKMLPAIAPDVCALTLPALLESAEPAVRATYRDLLTSVADAPSAGPPLRAALVDSTLGHSARFDLVRSLSPWARRYEPELGRTFSELIRPPLGFEEHYLMLSPAAQLASFDKRASDFLRAAFRSDVAELRLEAVRKADPLEFEPELRVAANDPSVRVREAALEALLPKESAEKLLLERLEDDEWPLIRAAAARALARLPASVTVDDGLIDALDDESRHVRRPAVTALGVRHSAQAAPRLRELIAKDDEDPYVRAAAATSLGQMCDLGALDVLTSYAQKLVSPELPEYEILVARAATMALASLGPRDLKARLGPLSKTGASPLARRIAREALALPARCDAPRARSAEASN